MKMIASVWKQPFHASRRFLAKVWLNFYPQVTIIGVTGSYGKTNTTRAIAQVLSLKYKTLQTDLDLDSIYNLPITILKLRPGHKILVLEYGIDHVGEMGFHLSLVKPQIGVLAGITPVHSDPGLLGSLEGIIQEKGKLLESLPSDGWAILNWDDENVRKMADKTKAKILWYGATRNCDFWADEIKVDFSGTSFNLHAEKLEKPSLKIKVPLIGEHFVHTALVAVAIGWIQGLTREEIASGLSKLEPLAGRMSLEKGPKGTVLLDDHLRASPASAMAGLKTLAVLPYQARLPARQGRKIAILGEMGELGKSAEEEHRKIGKFVASLKIDFLVSVGPLQKLVVEEAIKNGMKKETVFWAKDVIEAAEILKRILKKGDLLYLKGSLLRHLERIFLILGEKPVRCRVISCHFYEPCPSCPNLRKGI